MRSFGSGPRSFRVVVLRSSDLGHWFCPLGLMHKAVARDLYLRFLSGSPVVEPERRALTVPSESGVAAEPSTSLAGSAFGLPTEKRLQPRQLQDMGFPIPPPLPALQHPWAVKPSKRPRHPASAPASGALKLPRPGPETIGDFCLETFCVLGFSRGLEQQSRNSHSYSHFRESSVRAFVI